MLDNQKLSDNKRYFYTGFDNEITFRQRLSQIGIIIRDFFIRIWPTLHAVSVGIVFRIWKIFLAFLRRAREQIGI